MPTQADVIATTLARNDRFLREFIEPFTFCPYAARCRETGGLERRVVLGAPPTVDAFVAHIHELSQPAFAHVEVGLLIAPEFEGNSAEFEHLVSRVRETAKSASAFYAVAFHPQLAPDTDTPARFVSFLRRSPDPTIQLVRADLLERIRGPDDEDTVWVDPAVVDLENLELTPKRKSVSTRIADANFETMQRVGAERLLAVLQSIAAHR